mgnify:CR=1 FL=1
MSILAKANALEWERVREQGHESEGRQPRRFQRGPSA